LAAHRPHFHFAAAGSAAAAILVALNHSVDSGRRTFHSSAAHQPEIQLGIRPQIPPQMSRCGGGRRQRPAEAVSVGW
jgi:hypothetical protein